MGRRDLPFCSMSVAQTPGPTLTMPASDAQPAKSRARFDFGGRVGDFHRLVHGVETYP